MKGFPNEPGPMNQLEAAPVKKPEEAPAPKGGQAAARPPAQEPKSAAPVSAPSGGGEALPSVETKQLVLRAIFGVDHELTHQQIMQRARTLPGVKNIASVDAEAAGALKKVRELVSSIGFWDPGDTVLSSPEGTFDFISAGRTTLAILREGGYSPGVRETLILIAQEIDKL